MGALLLAGGAAGKRFCLPHSRIMIHQPLGGFQGQASDIDIHAREILLVRDRLNRILAPVSTGFWPGTPASRSRRSPSIPTGTILWGEPKRWNTA